VTRDGQNEVNGDALPGLAPSVVYLFCSLERAVLWPASQPGWVIRLPTDRLALSATVASDAQPARFCRFTRFFRFNRGASLPREGKFGRPIAA
jgi:hypothetical protein